MIQRGTRVRLISCSDPYTQLPSGAEGTVLFVDSMGTVHVKWDSGSTLGLVPGEDRYETIERGDPSWAENRKRDLRDEQERLLRAKPGSTLAQQPWRDARIRTIDMELARLRKGETA